MKPETITLKEIAQALGVPRGRIKSYFEKGRFLEYVPRPLNSNVQWVIYRKDFEAAVARKQAELEKSYKEWDELFEMPTFSED